MSVRTWWTNTLVIATLAGAVGAQDSTARAKHASKAAPIREQGTFHFVERSGAAGVVAEGSFTVTEDSVTVEMTPGPCRYDTRSRPGGAIGYICADAKLAFDRQHPSVRAMLTYQRSVMVRTVVCDAWNTDARGVRTTCKVSHVNSDESLVPTTIRLKPRRS